MIEFYFEWEWINSLGGTAFERMAVLMTLIVGWFFILSHTLEAIMLGYAKMFRDRIRAKAIEEVYEEVYSELQQALKEGKTLEEFLETHNKKKNDKNTPPSKTKKKE